LHEYQYVFEWSYFAMSSVERVQRPLLLVASSPSDLSELEGTARALLQRGHEVMLAYFYAGSSVQVHASSLPKLTLLAEESAGALQALAVDVDQSLQGKLDAIKGVASSRSKPAAATPEQGAWIVRLRIRLRVFSSRLTAARKRGWCTLRGRMEKNGSLARYHAFLTVLRAARRWLSRLMMIRMSMLYGGIATVQLYRIYRSYAAMFNALLEQENYRAIVVPEDVVGPFWPVLIKAGLKHDVPTVILPYTLANQEEAFKSLCLQEDFQTKYNRLAAYLYPKWRMKRDGYDIVRMPAGHVFAHQWLRIAPPDPWMMNSGRAKTICVDSQASFDYFLHAGIPATKLKVTGSVSQDSLASVLAVKTAGLKALRSELGLAGEKPLLLVSGCPNQLAGVVPRCEFSTMRHVADHLGQALTALADHYHLVVRPHPNYLEFGEFLKGHGVVSSLRPTAQLVPLSDVFIAFASATIRWACACGIPTINYDIFHYGYDDFSRSKGVFTVSASADFLRTVASMKPGSDVFQAARSASKADANYWSVMDGRGLERIERAINDAKC
jgi:hypothetical protein